MGTPRERRAIREMTDAKVYTSERVCVGSGGMCARMHAKSLQSCPTLCDTMDHSPPESSVRGILQARILEWVAISSSGASSQPRDQTHISYVSCIGRWVFTANATWKDRAGVYMHAKADVCKCACMHVRVSRTRASKCRYVQVYL